MDNLQIVKEIAKKEGAELGSYTEKILLDLYENLCTVYDEKYAKEFIKKEIRDFWVNM